MKKKQFQGLLVIRIVVLKNMYNYSVISIVISVLSDDVHVFHVLNFVGQWLKAKIPLPD